MRKSNEVPEEVRKARIRGDRDALSRMGRMGGQHGAILRDLHKKDLEGIAAEQAKLYTISPEGDVLPPADVSAPFTKKRG